MIEQYYNFLGSKNHTYFFFESEGKQGKIIKIVEFSPYKGNRWNLGFGDWQNGKINDSIITNNHDAMMVIRTVSKITLHFFEHYPDRIVYINPVDEKRKKLYNLVFKRHFLEISPIFDVIGYINEESETYSIEKNYDSFEIKLKIKT